MKRTSPLSIVALAVAMLALVASLGGASYAAKLITGKDIKNGTVTDKDIKNGTITATDVKKKSLTGTQVKDGSLTAADLKPGVAATKTFARRVAATPGATADAARGAAPQVLLYEAGPLAVYTKCFTDTSGPTTYSVTYVKSSENYSLFDSDYDEAGGGAITDFLNPDTDEEDRELMYESTGANSADYYGGGYTDFTAYAADGTSLLGFTTVAPKNGTLPGGNGPYGSGDACIVTGGIYGD